MAAGGLVDNYRDYAGGRSIQKVLVDSPVLLETEDGLGLHVFEGEDAGVSLN